MAPIAQREVNALSVAYLSLSTNGEDPAHEAGLLSRLLTKHESQPVSLDRKEAPINRLPLACPIGARRKSGDRNAQSLVPIPGFVGPVCRLVHSCRDGR